MATCALCLMGLKMVIFIFMIEYSLDKYKIKLVIVLDRCTMPSVSSCSEFVSVYSANSTL